MDEWERNYPINYSQRSRVLSKDCSVLPSLASIAIRSQTTLGSVQEDALLGLIWFKQIGLESSNHLFLFKLSR